MKKQAFDSHIKDEKGSLALEQVLFIGAIVLVGAGVFAFYGGLADYFSNFSISAVPGSDSFNLPTSQGK